MEKNVCKIKMGLVEKLGVHLENREQLAPVAARILSYVILTGKKGSTFEDMVAVLGASKSTVSSHLQHLQNLQKIEYFTKTGDRKKYFIIDKDMVVHHIDSMMQQWSETKQLHLEIKEYKEVINSEFIGDESEKFDLNFHNDYIKFLDGATASVEELRKKLIEK
ncbi:GbsR/MarR family transcriptional regulator [Crocinitomix catalasitica]|uniref:GbsR/MarR family transcriptional regulator n=1 Tax=Crocinitomix catalasitica TaxID=184607 RepID=UPI000482E1E0|nr:transcriptional regulator [Crocinitomix catalasitica]